MTSPSGDPARQTVQTTFRAEAIRALAVGIQETAVTTFAILIAVKQFALGPTAKATLIGSFAVGLIGGLFIVPVIARRHWRVSHAAGMIQLISMVGFLLASFSKNSEILYVAGMCLGMGILPMAIPLQTHYLRENFPDSSRGRLFSTSILIRALSAMFFSWLLGSWLDEDINRFPQVAMLFAFASGAAAVCQFLIPSNPFHEDVKKPPIGRSIIWLKEDRVFARMIAAAMAMGLGVLSANALRVDYLVNPAHTLEFDAETTALITGVIPSVTRLISTFFWGWLFDHMNFFKLRAIVNLVFFAGILLYFSTGDLKIIAIGSAMFGLARGGGEILWNLWVTKLADPSHIAGYMSVHTFMTGLRVIAASYLGFYIVSLSSISTLISVSSVFVILSFVILWPLVFG
ncbi:MAG: MFS transporter, partial [Verrucomicrobiales bacterium]|nr:MFS transporter [Verrucomicrobiales bacterium]